MDLNAACSGFVYGMVVGTNMIRGGTNRIVLVVGTEKLHHVMDFTDRTTSVLFGDGAGAVVLEPRWADRCPCFDLAWMARWTYPRDSRGCYSG
jgi:3-oxoacyl-[acyl-carrier-protein] synthase III